MGMLMRISDGLRGSFVHATVLLKDSFYNDNTESICVSERGYEIQQLEYGRCSKGLEIFAISHWFIVESSTIVRDILW